MAFQTATLSWIVTKNHRHYAALGDGYAFLNPDFTPVNYSSSRTAPVALVQAPAKGDAWLWSERLARLRTSGIVHNYTFPNLRHVVVLHTVHHSAFSPVAYMYDGVPAYSDASVRLDKPRAQLTPTTP